ncbi:hypothetical protein CYLTODRAFT_403804 [Cylindrobasidium torrendii FP15055 ss-10]|uniref:Anaphase-promoting complex subunit 5 n=1 Tax=Cylindrobasidium torrendii FP15055 ss-10 TaxID=1314674 RepID=A0A0D7AXD0_9AGAR|nr:hypothetical protein CYLTODRAFT_403804 [Cylindrobasidium torrendii FP15055 ss-10]
MNKLDKDGKKSIQPPSVLRPHHLVLCTALIVTYKERDPKTIPPAFLLHLQRTVLNEMSSTAEPKTFKEFILELGSVQRTSEATKLVKSIEFKHVELLQASKMLEYFTRGFPNLLVHDEESALPWQFHRRSLFGLFVRRYAIDFAKMSFVAATALHASYQRWCNHMPIEDVRVEEEPLTMRRQILKAPNDYMTWPKAEHYERFQHALATGEEVAASEKAREFFEQRFHDGNDSGLRQNAILNLVRMHYVRNEHETAKRLLQEGIQVARNAGDAVVLQHCATLLNRLEDNRRPPINEIQPHIHPYEILYDVKKLMEVDYDQPLAASFEKIVESIALYDRWLEVHPDPDNAAAQWAQHGVQAIVWEAAGCDKLADIEENIVISMTEQGGSDNNRLTAILNKAYRQARQGQYSESMAALLEPEVWRGLHTSDYNTLASQMWHIIVLRAARRGQVKLIDSLRARCPPGNGNLRHYTYKNDLRSSMGKIDEALHEVIRMKNVEAIGSSLQALLTSLWHSEFQQRLNAYRTSIILLADFGIEFKLFHRARQLITDILPQLITGNDLEQRALASFTLARSLIGLSGGSSEELNEALQHLLRAEGDFIKLEMYPQLKDVQFLLAVVYHNLGMALERDTMANKQRETTEILKAYELVTFDEEVWQVLDIVASIGYKLAAR